MPKKSLNCQDTSLLPMPLVNYLINITKFSFAQSSPNDTTPVPRYFFFQYRLLLCKSLKKIDSMTNNFGTAAVSTKISA